MPQLEFTIESKNLRTVPQPTVDERKPPEEESESEQSAKQDLPQQGTEWRGFGKRVYRKKKK
jgi:hypothetical protein